ncbi:MAG: hypothetical protein O2821_09105 [Chloroflexi bacterium]|nr:hypothetical protein [Chloroflexota bacterium]MDA1227425.1 hypothetical protein [Chloroflexota bacterium]
MSRREFGTRSEVDYVFEVSVPECGQHSYFDGDSLHQRSKLTSRRAGDGTYGSGSFDRYNVNSDPNAYRGDTDASWCYRDAGIGCYGHHKAGAKCGILASRCESAGP